MDFSMITSKEQVATRFFNLPDSAVLKRLLVIALVGRFSIGFIPDLNNFDSLFFNNGNSSVKLAVQSYTPRDARSLLSLIRRAISVEGVTPELFCFSSLTHTIPFVHDEAFKKFLADYEVSALKALDSHSEFLIVMMNNNFKNQMGSGLTYDLSYDTPIRLKLMKEVARFTEIKNLYSKTRVFINETTKNLIAQVMKQIHTDNSDEELNKFFREYTTSDNLNFNFSSSAMTFIFEVARVIMYMDFTKIKVVTALEIRTHHIAEAIQYYFMTKDVKFPEVATQV